MTIEQIVKIAQDIDYLYFEITVFPNKKEENEKKIMELVDTIRQN